MPFSPSFLANALVVDGLLTLLLVLVLVLVIALVV